jgi:TAG lipase/steryl ester hydrolase/phospholipase A2/LPA acyltransferase
MSHSSLSPSAPQALQELHLARSYDEWRTAAKAYDRARGLDAWRQEDRTRRYDHGLIRQRLDQIRALRADGDDHGLLYLLNEGIHGNFGGMGRAGLYEKTTFGTKVLVEEYVEATVEALEHLAEPSTSSIPEAEKYDFFLRASRCFGRSALMLSGSGTLFFFHIGVLRALVQEGLLPRVISGSSGGALVASVLGTHPPSKALEVLTPRHFREFLRPEQGERRPFKSLLAMAAAERDAMISRIMPDLTFAEAARRSGLDINISIAPVETHQSSRLLNAVASPHVFVREGVLASTALPGLLPPKVLAARNRDGERQPYLPQRRWVDGSASNDLPAKRLARLYGVNHYIVSQTNPHVLPFVTDAKLDRGPRAVLLRTLQRVGREVINGGAEMFHRRLLRDGTLPRLINQTLAVLNQDYLGDINIVAPPGQNPLRVLSWQSMAEAEALVEAGERATWPQLERIRLSTRIGRTLDGILARYGVSAEERAATAPALRMARPS